MKISEMTNEQAADVFTRLAIPLGNMCDDKTIEEIINKYKALEGEIVLQRIGKVLPDFVLYAMKTHRDDLFEIVGALTEQSRAKAAKMKFLETVKVLRECIEDEELRDFFTSFGDRMKKTADESSQG